MRVGGLKIFIYLTELILKHKAIRHIYEIYTLLCAVLRERWGKLHAGRMCVAPLAWLVQRSNIAHNVLGVYEVGEFKDQKFYHHKIK
jgi:hypothetical protein